MKKQLLLIILSIFITSVGYTQIATSSCQASDSLHNAYQKYATQLAVRRLYELHSPDTSFIKVQQASIDSVFSAIMAVYNLKNSAVRDTIFDMYGIGLSRWAVHEVIMKVDTTKSWVDNWKNGIRLTGDKRIDSLMTKYQLDLKEYNDYYVLLISNLYLNIKALSLAFETHQDVIYAEANTWHTNGVDIYYKTENNAQYLIFSHGEGDCPSGCFWYRYWSFKIYSDCSVEYLGGYDRLPPLAIEDEYGQKKDELVIFPNPADDYLIIQANEIEKVEVFNAIGQNINIPDPYYFNVGKVKLDLSRLSTGIYFLKINIVHKSAIKKVLLKK